MAYMASMAPIVLMASMAFICLKSEATRQDDKTTKKLEIKKNSTNNCYQF